MLIWISMLLVFGALATLGYYQGAIRFVISLVGMVAGFVLAPIGGILLSPLVGKLGVTNPIWVTALAFILAFLIVYGIGLGLAQFVHRKVEHYYKYRAEDVKRLRWERLNQKLGIPLGLFAGAAWILPLCLGVYVGGYPTVQLSVEDNATGAYKYMNMARHGLVETGLDKTVSRFDPMPSEYYEVSDVLGLLYQNPILLNRLAKYPPFLRANEDPTLADFGNDQEYMNLILSKSDIAQIMAHPRSLPLLTTAGLYMATTGAELSDLHEYLKTGKSAKYDDKKILGRWKLNVRATLAQARKKNPDMTSREMAGLRASTPFLSTITLMATTDEKFILQAGQTAAAEPVAAAAPVDPMAARYGLQAPRGGAVNPGAAMPVRPQPSRSVVPTLEGKISPIEGTWKLDLDRYELSAGAGPFTAVVEGSRLTISHPVTTLVFDKEA